MTPDEEALRRILERLRAGEILSGSFMHDHGLPSPIVERSSLRFERGSFLYERWWEDPGALGEEPEKELRRLGEGELREVLAGDRPLRAALGLA